MIYIDNGKNVVTFHTSIKVENAIKTLLLKDENLVWSTTHDGYEVSITEKENVNERKD